MQQPTGGPLLLQDTQPDEPKSLIEEKLKKVTTEKAPVAGPSQDRQDGRAGQRRINDISQLLQMAQRSSAAAAPAAAGSGSGAAAAAGVLTAVDEDGEGDEEATPPQDFDYFTDAESDGED